MWLSLQEKSTSVNLADVGPESRSLCLLRGAPSYIFKQKLTISKDQGLKPCSGMLDGYNRTVSVSTQMNFVNKSLQEPYRNTFFIIGVDDTEARAQVLGAAFMASAIAKQQLEKRRHSALPLWYSVFGGRWDKLRDDTSWRNTLNKVGLLILANIAVNSTPEKIEKVRDLLDFYKDVPRVLIVAGGDPLLFASNQLYIRPNRCIYLCNRTRKDIQL